MSSSNIPIIYVSANKETSLEKALSEAVLQLVKEEVEDPKSFVHPDLRRVTGEGSIGIEEVKKLIQYISKKPYQAKRVAAVIHPGHLLTKEAQNAMLKTLEEPPEFANIYLTTTHISLLLPTILSRSKIVQLDDSFDAEKAPISVFSIYNAPIHEGLERVDEILRNNRNIEKLIDLWMLEVRAKDKNLAKILIQAKRMLKANVSAGHVLDYIFLDRP